MKYILLTFFYLLVVVYHLCDIIIRTICNFFILTWDFKWSSAELFSYKDVYIIGDKHSQGKTIKVSQLYSYNHHFKD